jgi:hypothetical protein
MSEKLKGHKLDVMNNWWNLGKKQLIFSRCGKKEANLKVN